MGGVGREPQVRALFEGNEGPLMRACINVATEYHDIIGPVLGHAAHTNGIGREMIRILLNHGADVNGRDQHDQTPLMLLVWREYDTGQEAIAVVQRGLTPDLIQRAFLGWMFYLHCFNLNFMCA